MSLKTVSKQGDEYYTPDYVVEILIPHLKKLNIETIWCPFDKEFSEYVKIFKREGYNVIATHIDNGQDFLEYTPDFEFDAIISNPPFSIKNHVFEKTISYGKYWALLMSATSIQSASFMQILAKEDNPNFIMFDKRISYSGDRPPFPSWYFTGHGLLDKNYFYIYDTDPKKLYKSWVDNGGHSSIQ